MKRRLLALCLLASLTNLAAAAPSSIPLPAMKHGRAAQFPGCPKDSATPNSVDAIDISDRADKTLLDKAHALGVTTIFRYYDWADGPLNTTFDYKWEPGPTKPEKTLVDWERDMILKEGFRLGIVFQHHPPSVNKLLSFKDSKRAAFDARRVLQLARELKQPHGTVIFFGVDFDVQPSEVNYVKTYFKTVKSLIEPKYVVGVYGSGYACARIKGAGLASYCWLSNSTGHLDSQTYESPLHGGSGDWDLKQCGERDAFPGSRDDFDLSVFNRARRLPPFWRAR